MRLSLIEATGAILVCALAALLADDALAAAMLLVFLAGMKLVATRDRLFVLAAGFTLHWTQVTLGLSYKWLTGREVQALNTTDYRTMVYIGLGCCLALAIGISIGLRLVKPPDPSESRPEFAVGFPTLLIAYIVMTSFEGTLGTMAMDYPSARQILVTADSARLGVLFLVYRRLLRPEPRWGLLTALLLFEIMLGFTGFFAGFREPIVLCGIAILEIFDHHNVRQWFALGAAGAAVVALGLLWMAIRVDFRREYVTMDNFEISRSAKLQNFQNLSSAFLQSDADTMLASADKLVDRMWTIYYPALAIERVPRVLPHTDGRMFTSSVTHILTPRIFFPNKPNLQSDSEKVRLYSGVQVAGADQNTSIAFGYAAESYIDFGLPWMFIPPVLFGILVGASYALFRKLIWHRELAVAFLTVAFWLSIYLFERSWSTMLGVWLGFMVYLGIPVLLLDRFLLVKHINRLRSQEGLLYDERRPSEAG
jgi:hypothetical protein